jgi:hypothetical protein
MVNLFLVVVYLCIWLVGWLVGWLGIAFILSLSA